MAAVCRAYSNEEEARRAVDALIGAGIPGQAIRVVMGESARDTRTEPEGAFAEEVEPPDVVGEFAGPGQSRAAGTGTFAGEAGAQRGGSFGDIDRETVTSYPGGVERQRVAGHRALHRLLVDAGLDKETADRDVAALHDGRILVVADVGERSPEEVSETLD
jgi:hypothetical protein